METTPVELLTLPTGPWPGMHTLLIEISTDPLSSGGMKTLEIGKSESWGVGMCLFLQVCAPCVVYCSTSSLKHMRERGIWGWEGGLRKKCEFHIWIFMGRFIVSYCFDDVAKLFLR